MRHVYPHHPAIDPARHGVTVKLRSNRGVTLVELLVAMTIAVLASAVVLRSLDFSARFYLTRTGDTEAELLCETVCLLLQDDLTNHVTENPANLNMNDYGKPRSIDNLSLSDACYGAAGERTVKITVTDTPPYTVTVQVRNAAGNDAAISTFTVNPVK